MDPRLHIWSDRANGSRMGRPRRWPRRKNCGDCHHPIPRGGLERVGGEGSEDPIKGVVEGGAVRWSRNDGSSFP